MYFSPSINGFFSADVHSSMPSDVVKISDERHAELLSAQAAGQQIVAGVDGYPHAIDVPIVPSEFKAAVQRRIDDAAEQERLRYITSGAGQALVYQRKEAQARACLAAHDALNPPALGAFPALDTEIGITGADTLAVAEVVVELADAWGAIADHIEAVRLAAKFAIAAVPDDAPDIEAQITAIETGITWPAP